MDDTRIQSEMHEIVAEALTAGQIVPCDRLVLTVMDKRTGIEGEDAPFYRVHAYRNLMRIAKRVVGKYDADDSTSAEMLLPGFKHLSRAYPMTRDGEIALVPITLCGDDELRDRARQLDEMAKGCTAHAREIREYLLARAPKAA